MRKRRRTIWGGGYGPYRYGEKRPVYDPSKAQPSGPILNPQQQASVVDRVAKQMRGWESSPFEFEAAARHHLRRGYCENGHAWQRSDAQAAAVVAAALSEDGPQRPTWEEGQPYVTLPPDHCAWCGCAVAPENDGPKGRFCSVSCAKAALAYMSFERSYYLTSIGKSAKGLIDKARIRERQPARHCAHCNALFHPDPYSKTEQIYCSHRCYHEHERAPTYAKECAWCAKPFLAVRPDARFCCKSCNEQHFQVRSGKWVPKRLSPPVFDYFVTVPETRIMAARFDEIVRSGGF